MPSEAKAKKQNRTDLVFHLKLDKGYKAVVAQLKRDYTEIAKSLKATQKLLDMNIKKTKKLLSELDTTS